MNLKPYILSLFVSVGCLTLTGCFEAPNFPDIPEIKFNKVEFVQAPPNVTVADTLLITIDYQDGDGDLGLDESFNDDIRYAPILFPVKENNAPFRIADIGTPINVVGFDESEIPPYEGCYIDNNWFRVPGENPGEFIDTVFFVSNENSLNIFVKIFQKNSQGDFEETDWFEELNLCSVPTNARFPLLREDLESSTPIDGTLTYSFRQISLSNTFKDDVLKLEIYIQDRALNKSNVVTSDEFTLASIQK